jgi:hypothetical protein
LAGDQIALFHATLLVCCIVSSAYCRLSALSSFASKEVLIRGRSLQGANSSQLAATERPKLEEEYLQVFADELARLKSEVTLVSACLFMRLRCTVGYSVYRFCTGEVPSQLPFFFSCLRLLPRKTKPGERSSS